MRLSVLINVALGGFLVVAIPAPATDRHILHEKRDGEPIAWKRQARAAGHEHIPLKIGLKQRNLEHADRFISQLSHPKSPQYGQHWSPEKVANMFAPAKEAVDQTILWLVANGIDADRLTFGTGRNWINFEATVAEAEHLLHTKYYQFKHVDATGGRRLACDSYSLPGSIRDHIDFVMPTIHLDGLRPVAQAKQTTSAAQGGLPSGLTGLKHCNKLITIDCLRAIYNFGKGNYSDPSNRIGIAEWENVLDRVSLKTYFHHYTSPEIPQDTLPEFVGIDGGKNESETPDPKTLETGLDVQTSYAMIWPQGIRRYQIGDSVNVNGEGTFNIFADALDGSYCTYLGGDEPYLDPLYPDPSEGGYQGPLQCGGAPLSNVISVSYSQIEAALPRFYQQRQCYEWMKLGLQGVSLVFSAGDAGVANKLNSQYNNTCVNIEYGYIDQFGKQFSPGFPVNCPYITAVGATQLKGKSIYGGEMAVAKPFPGNPYLDYHSGGGFSQVFPRPAYQHAAVATYLDKYAPAYPADVFNRSGRGIPDVATLGYNIAVVANGITVQSGGTSASAPIFASILNLINEERLHAGKKPVGFVNPVMYQNPGMFNDITEGSNPGCGTQGFPAAPGWDPVTGLGTPNYERMLKVFMALP